MHGERRERFGKNSRKRFWNSHKIAKLNKKLVNILKGNKIIKLASPSLLERYHLHLC